MNDEEEMEVVSASMGAVVHGLTEVFDGAVPDILLVAYTVPRLQWTTTVTKHVETAKMIDSLLGHWKAGSPKVEVEPDSLAGEVALKLPEMGAAVHEIFIELTGDVVPFSLMMRSEIGVQYVAKAAREDVIPVLEELAASLRSGVVMPAAHKVRYQ